MPHLSRLRRILVAALAAAATVAAVAVPTATATADGFDNYVVTGELTFEWSCSNTTATFTWKAPKVEFGSSAQGGFLLNGSPIGRTTTTYHTGSYAPFVQSVTIPVTAYPKHVDVGYWIGYSAADTAFTYPGFDLPTTCGTGSGSPVVNWVAGADRYDVAVNIADQAYPTTAQIVYVATGANYPDALSAGPAAAYGDGPLLLTDSTALTPSVATKISNLHPAKIVVVGGVNSVSAAVFDELAAIQPNTVRQGGADRYEASRNLVESAFPDGAGTVYIATGANFPDALSAGSAAATMKGAVLLVNGSASAPDEATLATLSHLNVHDIVIAGGPNSVSTGIEDALRALPGVSSVAREGGADRFAASVNINAAAFPTASRAFLATGFKFPDALAGSAWAGAIDAPLYVATSDCVPPGALAAMRDQGVRTVTLLGGPATLTQAVEALTPCAS